MNESNLIQLKIIVERAVRPVRAGFARKRKMREELLAHVSDVFEEESANLGDERTALARTAQRFGNPAELTAQLQATVPAGDVIDRFITGQPGESTLRAATRLASWNLVLAVILFAVATLLTGQGNVWPKEAILFTLGSILLLPAFMFSLTFATEWIRQARYEPARRSKLRAAGLTLLWFVYVLALVEGVAWLGGTNALGEDSLNRIWLLLWLAASLPWMPWALAPVAERQACYQREWASLRIE